MASGRTLALAFPGEHVAHRPASSQFAADGSPLQASEAQVVALSRDPWCCPQPGGEYGKAGGSHPTAARGALLSTGQQQLAEVVLECICSNGIDCRNLAPAQRAITLEVPPGASTFQATLGRSHQPDFFETLIPEQANLWTISRAHFSLSWEAPAGSVMLWRLTRNSLVVDGKPMHGARQMLLVDGSTVGFNTAPEAPCFLQLRLSLRSCAAVEAQGPHMAWAPSRQRPVQASLDPFAAAAVLECVRSSGVELTSVDRGLRAVVLPLDKAINLGRAHQPEIFQELLGADSRWFGFISRTHCRLLLSRSQVSSRGSLSLWIENLSTNVVLVCGRVLPQGQGVVASEGALLAFVAGQSGSPQQDVVFLEFMLRRARALPSLGSGFTGSLGAVSEE